MTRAKTFASLVTLLILTACGSPTVAPGSGPATSGASSKPAGGSTTAATKKAATKTTASFKDKVVYPDGLEVEVTAISSKKMGEFAALSTGKAKKGTPYSLLKVRIRNGSKAKVDLVGSGAVTFGPDGDAAPAVFDGDSGQPVTGSVLPGKAKTGSYGFAVPSKYLGDATLEFTADFKHPAAVFSGSLK